MGKAMKTTWVTALQYLGLQRSAVRQGFTLVELVVSLAVLGIVSTLLLHASARAKQVAVGALCWGNLRQLQLSWQLYVDDHAGRLPSNRCGLTNGVWRSTPDSWAGPSNAREDDSLESLQGLLRLGSGGRLPAASFHCPADRTRVERGGQLMRQSRLRSYSLNGNLAGETNEPQRVVHAEEEIPEPSRLLGFLDEHPDSIDDGHFLVWPAPDDRWVNLPADRHAGAGTLSMVDGHVETWNWQASKSFRDRRAFWKRAAEAADLADLRRLQSATLEFFPAP